MYLSAFLIAYLLVPQLGRNNGFRQVRYIMLVYFAFQELLLVLFCYTRTIGYFVNMHVESLDWLKIFNLLGYISIHHHTPRNIIKKYFDDHVKRRYNSIIFGLARLGVVIIKGTIQQTTQLNHFY